MTSVKREVRFLLGQYPDPFPMSDSVEAAARVFAVFGVVSNRVLLLVVTRCRCQRRT